MTIDRESAAYAEHLRNCDRCDRHRGLCPTGLSLEDEAIQRFKAHLRGLGK